MARVPGSTVMTTVPNKAAHHRGSIVAPRTAKVSAILRQAPGVIAPTEPLCRRHGPRNPRGPGRPARVTVPSRP